MVKRLLRVAAAAVLVAACSGRGGVESGRGPTPTTAPVEALIAGDGMEPGPACGGRLLLVEADEVIARHQLTIDERQLIDWALARFEVAGLLLPDEIEFVFDPTGEECHGNIGSCTPPNGTARARVCLPAPEAAHRRPVVLLHELAHLWDWAQGDGLTWPDRSAIVGGSTETDGVEWEDRATERAAEVLTWGLYDGAVRPYTHGLATEEICEQYVALTGSLPPEPARALCDAGVAA